MQPSPAMQALIEQIYYIFRRYPVPSRFHVCCPYCFSEEQQQALRGVSLRAIPFPLLHAWEQVLALTHKMMMRFAIYYPDCLN